MARTITLPKRNLSHGRVKGKALFETFENNTLLGKELTILAPGEKITIEPGHKLWVCLVVLSQQKLYHTRSKTTLTGPLVYHVQPCTTLSLCQRVQNTVKISAVFAVFAGAFAFFIESTPKTPYLQSGEHHDDSGMRAHQQRSGTPRTHAGHRLLFHGPPCCSVWPGG